MLGQAYFIQKKYGMAKVHLKRAGELNPRHPVVQKYLHLVEPVRSKTKRNIPHYTIKSHQAKSHQAKSHQAKSHQAKSYQAQAVKDVHANWLGRLFGNR